MFDFTAFQESIYPAWERRFRSGPGDGEFSYKQGGPTSLYGSTDIVFCRAIMGLLPEDGAVRDRWASVINRFQDPATGWYRKTYTHTHPREHTTAYAVSALTLLGGKPVHAMAWVPAMLASHAARRRWLRSVPWSIIWMGSHVLAGRPAIMEMTGTMTSEFRDWYFDWLNEHVAPSGFWQRGIVHRLGIIRTPTKHEMGGAFHMHFLYEHARRAWRYPEAAIDHCLRLQQPNGFWDGETSYCIDLDALYVMTRSSRIAGGYRATEIRASAERYLESAAALFNEPDRVAAAYPVSHPLPGALAAIAECARTWPGLVKTSTPWVQTLDRGALYI